MGPMGSANAVDLALDRAVLAGRKQSVVQATGDKVQRTNEFFFSFFCSLLYWFFSKLWRLGSHGGQGC